MSTLELLLHLDRTLGTVIADFGMGVYLVLFLIVFCETAVLPLFFLPANPLLFLTGAFAASGRLAPDLLIMLLIVAAWSGSVVNYLLGRRVGHALLTPPTRWVDAGAVRQTQAFYARHGRVCMLGSLFVPVVRTFSPFVCGLAAMRFGRFAVYTLLGVLLWVGVFVSAGYFFGNLPLIRDHLNLLLVAGVTLGVGGLIGVRGWRALRQRRDRHAA